jgi:hypothetical protein
MVKLDTLTVSFLPSIALITKRKTIPKYIEKYEYYRITRNRF